MLVMLCLLVYGNSLHGDFVFDDDRAILENPIVNTDFSPVAGMPVVRKQAFPVMMLTIHGKRSTFK